MSFGLGNAVMLAALAGVALPLLIHLLSRRRVPTVDWGAMMFVDPGRRARTRIRLAELILMLGRMALLGVVALAAARPFLKPAPMATAEEGAQIGSSGPTSSSGARRDIVVVVDGSESMGLRSPDGRTPRSRAEEWIDRLIGRLRTGDAVAIVVAGARPKLMLDALSSDLERVGKAVEALPGPAGGSDLSAALAEAFRLLERSRNPLRDVVVLTDGQRAAWRPEEGDRWKLLRELHERMPVKPGIWVERLAVEPGPETADGSVGSVELARSLVAPGVPLEVSATIFNAGPAPMSRSVEVLRDGQPEPGSSRQVGPIPPGGRMPVSFQVRLDTPGAHVIAVRLNPDDQDPQLANDELARPVEAEKAMRVLLIDGEPGREPLSGEVDFLRAALAPRQDEAGQFVVKVSPLEELTTEALDGVRVLALANVASLSAEQAAVVGQFVGEGGGLLFVPGDRTDAAAINAEVFRDGSGWLPSGLGEFKGDPGVREVVGHPEPSTFHGPVLGPLARGDEPPLARAGLFAYWLLDPLESADPPGVVLGRLDTGDPWLIERSYRRGRVAMLAGPLDAEGGTLPVNPDFVPFVHELVFHLADPVDRTAPVPAGSSLRFALEEPPAQGVDALEVITPTGREVEARVERAGGRAVARLDDATEPGLYRLALPDPAGGSAYAVVLPDPSEADRTALLGPEAEELAKGWPLVFDERLGKSEGESDGTLADRLLATGAPASSPRPLWRGLIVLALVGLCGEVWLTRRMTRGGASLPS